MKVSPCGFVALALACLSGCQFFYGPYIYNNTDHELQITADFLRRSSKIRLNPHVAYTQRQKGEILLSLVVDDNGQRREYGIDVLEPMLRRFFKHEDAVVVIHEDTIEVFSLKEARRKGLFRKR